MIRKSILWGLMVSLAACTGGGPRTTSVLNAPNATLVARDVADPYVVIDVDQAVAGAVTQAFRAEPVAFFESGAPGRLVIGLGDTVQVSIVTQSDAGFVDFNNAALAPLSSTTLPPQTVREGGTINIPPVGRILASGKTVASLEHLLEEKLSEVLVDPSVIVQLVDRRSARATIVGAVANPGSIALNEVDTRLIDIIAAAGGPTARTEDLQLTLSRRGRSASVTLDRLFQSPVLNVAVRPGDVISIETADHKITVLGAGGLNETIRFDEPGVTVADALGRAGGIDNRRAARQGVFLYRQTPKPLVSRLGGEAEHIPGEAVPTVYRFDLREPSMLFAANAFDVADGDVLYISDNIAEEVNAVVSAVTTFVPAPAEFVRDVTFGDPTP